MKRLLLLMGITAGCIAANAQAPTAPKTAPKPTKYSKDADLSRLVIDLNLKGGGLMQKYSLTNENLYNSAVVYNRGELKFNNGMSFGGDLQLGVFLGKNRHFGIGTGILYFSQSGEATMENFNVANKETDSKGNAYRQIITATDKITEKLTITNINLPLVLKYKNRLSQKWGVTGDVGLLFNFQHSNSYNSNAMFDYEAVYRLQTNSDGTKSYVFDNTVTPDVNSLFYTKSYFYQSHPGATKADLDAYFLQKRTEGINVATGVKPTNTTGDYAMTTGSVGFIIQPAVNYFLSDNFALNLGVYYTYQSIANSNNINNKIIDKGGNYNTVLKSVTSNDAQSFGVNLGVRYFIGNNKDTDEDGIPDKKDSCVNEPGLAAFHGCPDRDKDGVPDRKDECPDVFGLAQFNGCPDRDGDGIPDKADACPDVAGLAKYQGCPDRDGDGVIDKNDDCPDVPGLASLRGCPDRDGDGVPDKDDKCPDEKGLAEYQGCPPPPPPPPPAPAEQDTFILNFKVNSSELDEYSKEKLKGLAEKLKNDKDYKAEVTVKGHADNTGTDRINIPLSKKRAYVVYNYLTKTLHVPKKRLQYPPVGKGSSEPLDDNSTPEGRAKNRRATIHFK